MPPPRVRVVLAGLAAVFALLTVAPYAIGAARTPPGARFTSLVYNDFDQEYYLASQRSAAEGLRPNRFSSEPDAPGPISELYPLIGHMGAWSGVDPALLYHATRVIAATALPFLVFALMAACFPGSPRRALEGTALALFTTGLGTLAPGVFSWRTGGDLVVVEATALRSAAVLPHFAVAYLGITACLMAVVVAVRQARLATIVAWAAGGGLLIAVSHTFLLLPVGLTVAVWVAWGGWRWVRGRAPFRHVALIATAGIAMLVPAVPSLLALRNEMARFEAIQGKAFQSTPSDHPLTWIAVYALLLPFAIAGLWTWKRNRPHAGLAVLTTLLVIDFVLVLTPFTPFQRRFCEGAVIPLAALAACGLTSLAAARRPLFAVVTAMALLGASRLGTTATYLPESDWHAFDRIGRDDVVLAGARLSAAIPAFSSGTVYVARPVETMHYAAKKEVRNNFAEEPTSPALEKLRAAGVNLIISDLEDPTFAIPAERFPPSCFDPAGSFESLRFYRPRLTCPVEPAANR